VGRIRLVLAQRRVDARVIRTLATLVGIALLSISGSATPALATYPGEPGLIAFTRDLSDSIWLMEADGRDQRRLLRTNERQRDPAWSPSGAWLMYAARGLWIVRADGSNGRQVAPFASDGSWSPDGSRLVFTSRATRTDCTDIYSMRLNRTMLRKLTSTNACERDPSYSPDGKWIVFQAQTPYATHIVVKRADGRGITTVVGNGHSPDWSPDGTSIAFAVESQIRVVDRAGKQLRELELESLSDGRFDVLDVSWSPSGDAFAFSQVQASPRAGSRGAGRIYRVRLDGSELRELTVTGIDADAQPAWQPKPR
jgi:TolB protein